MTDVVETGRGLCRAALRTVGIGAFTAVEAAAFAVWVAILGGFVAVPSTVGVGVLAVGLFVGGVLAYVTVNGVRGPKPTLWLAVLAASKTALWVGWLVVAERVGGVVGPVAAGLALAALLVPQHTLEDNVLRRNAVASTVVDRATAGFSAVEAAGGTACLLLATHGGPVVAALNGLFAVDALAAGTGIAAATPEAVLGVSVLTAALFVAHLLRVRHALRQPERRSTPMQTRTHFRAARQD